MRSAARGMLATALTALFIAGCSMAPSITQRLSDQDPDQLLSQAAQQAPEQAALTRLEAADILARQNRRPQALEVASNIDDQQLPSADRLRWALLLSDLGESEGDPDAVIRAGQLLSTESPPAEQANLLLERLARALATNAMPLESSAAFLRLQRATQRQDLNDSLWEQLIKLSSRDLKRLASGRDELTQGWLELVDIYRSSGSNIERLLARVDSWRGRRANHPAARQLPSDILALRDLDLDAVSRIAVFLPESGPLEGVAEALEKGIRTQHDQSASSTDSAIRLTFYDSSSASLDELYRRASASGAQVVIGPLSKDRVSELEKRDSVALPTLALNYGEGGRNMARGLYQFGLSAEDEAR
ncbi:MAG TPA: penicillin-binding protein activator, partial [Halomonas sp.]|nr:penicillin-binding protein activator [Halomonas sp.]